MKNKFFLNWGRHALPVFVALRLILFVSDASMVLAASRFETTASAQINQNSIYYQPFTPEEFLSLTNQARSSRQLPPLTLNDRLVAAALAKAEDMANKGYWEHFRPVDGKAPWDFIKENGYEYKVAGENLARGFRTPKGITNAWMNSRSHQDNILSPKYDEVGFACLEAAGENGERVLLTVQMFGSR